MCIYMCILFTETLQKSDTHMSQMVENAVADLKCKYLKLLFISNNDFNPSL